MKVDNFLCAQPQIAVYVVSMKSFSEIMALQLLMLGTVQFFSSDNFSFNGNMHLLFSFGTSFTVCCHFEGTAGAVG